MKTNSRPAPDSRRTRAALATLAGFVLATALDTAAAEKIIFSGRIEKHALPKLADRENFLPQSANLIPRNAPTEPGADLLTGSPVQVSPAEILRQQRLIEERRNWLQSGLGNKSDPARDSNRDASLTGKNGELEPRSKNLFDLPSAGEKTDAKRARENSNSKDSQLNRDRDRDRFDPTRNPRDEFSRTGTRPGDSTSPTSTDTAMRSADSIARLPGQSATDARGLPNLRTDHFAPRIGAGLDTPVQQKLDREMEFRRLFDARPGEAPRTTDFIGLSPEMTRQQQGAAMSRAFEDMLRRPEPVRSAETLRPKINLPASLSGNDAAKSANLADFSRIMAPAPPPERPRTLPGQFEIPKRAF